MLIFKLLSNFLKSAAPFILSLENEGVLQTLSCNDPIIIQTACLKTNI